MSGLQKLSLKTISEMDEGRLEIAFNQALERIRRDMVDRPSLPKDRTLTLTVVLSPLADENGDLDEVDVDFKLKDAIPARQSRSYRMAARGGDLLFNELSRDNPNQQTIPMNKTGTEDGDPDA